MVQKLLIFLEGGAGDGCATQQHQKKNRANNQVQSFQG